MMRIGVHLKLSKAIKTTPSPRARREYLKKALLRSCQGFAQGILSSVQRLKVAVISLCSVRIWIIDAKAKSAI